MSDAFDDHMAEALKADMAKLDALAYRERRERIATAALQGLLAADFDYSTSALAERAVRYADALISELDKPVKP